MKTLRNNEVGNAQNEKSLPSFKRLYVVGSGAQSDYPWDHSRAGEFKANPMII